MLYYREIFCYEWILSIFYNPVFKLPVQKLWIIQMNCCGFSDHAFYEYCGLRQYLLSHVGIEHKHYLLSPTCSGNRDQNLPPALNVSFMLLTNARSVSSLGGIM